MIERSQIGTETLVHSHKKAAQITKDVRKFALEAPLFGTEQMMKTSQQLIGAGYEAKNVVPYLRTFSDTLSALGRRPEDLQRMTYAFVQMMSKGQISAEELRGQLGEIFPAQKILAREMGLTTDEFAKKMKQGAFKGKENIMLLLRGMEKDFGGATAKMSKTFDGQMANLRESAKYTLGILFMPLFTHLEKEVFPVLQDMGNEIVDILKDSSLSADEKFQHIAGAADFWLGPIWDDFWESMNKIDWGEKISSAINAAAPDVMSSAGKLGAKATEEFFQGWWQSDIWGKLFGALVIGKIIGFKNVFGALGKAAGKAFGRKAAAETVAAEQMTLFGESGTKAGGKWGRAAGAAGRLAFVAGITLGVYEAGHKVNEWLQKQDWYKPPGGKGGMFDFFGNAFGSFFPKKPKGKEKEGWGKIIGEGPLAKLLTGQYGKDAYRAPGAPMVPSLAAPKMGAHPPAFRRLQPTLPKLAITNKLIIDGREVARVVAKHESNQARRR
jgi:tape measure domain-containing protein